MGERKMIVQKCFACGQPVRFPSQPCPHCGYQFTADDNTSCPNRSFANCMITGNLCQHSSHYGKCPIKNEVEREIEN